MTEMTSSYAQDVRMYYQVLSAKRKNFREALEHVDRYLSTGFNVFDFIAPNENGVSDVLKELLDPKGSHGQGRAFLERFLKLLDIDLDVTCSPSVRREARTYRSDTSYRRMDILIDLGTKGVAIETKLRAADQPNQIAAYHEELSRRYGSDYHVVYLTPSGGAPSEFTAGSLSTVDPRHPSWSFGNQILGWLDECHAICQSDKYRWFIRDFSEYLRNSWSHAQLEASNAS